ncbi:MAG: hypothetical protein IK027_02960 [Deltaproteobacteria bacterium]|nr:hypothetical protein [Deltaproteobacteria bacterium]
MNGTRFLWGFFLAVTFLIPQAVFADVPGISPEERQRRFEERMGMQRIQPPVDARVDLSEDGFLELSFESNGPGEVKYVLRGPQTGKEGGPVVAAGHRILKQQGQQVLVEKVALPVLKDNEAARYTLDATFCLKVFEKTNFGIKETDLEQAEQITRHFILRRQNGVYHVVR